MDNSIEKEHEKDFFKELLLEIGEFYE